jgi:anion-transporting  ArsA/GET3 family ATPase
VPDTRQTFEAFVHTLAPKPASAERVFRNPIFKIFAKEFSGTNEYMALQRLHSLAEKSGFDFIVLDTPPSRNTLDFLDAPKLLARFFDDRIIRWFVLPANRLVSGGMRKALGILEKLTGSGFMTHLFDFAAALFEVRATFTASLSRITALLESQGTGFLMVASASETAAAEAVHFVESVRSHHFRFDGAILNRTLGHLKITDPERMEARADDTGGTTAAFKLLEHLISQEERVVSELKRTLSAEPLRLPELARDVHSLEDLLHVALSINSGEEKSGD